MTMTCGFPLPMPENSRKPRLRCGTFRCHEDPMADGRRKEAEEIPISNSDDRHQADQEPRRVLGPVGQFIALVTALVIDLTIKHLTGA